MHLHATRLFHSWHRGRALESPASQVRLRTFLDDAVLSRQEPTRESSDPSDECCRAEEAGQLRRGVRRKMGFEALEDVRPTIAGLVSRRTAVEQ